MKKKNKLKGGGISITPDLLTYSDNSSKDYKPDNEAENKDTIKLQLKMLEAWSFDNDVDDDVDEVMAKNI